MNERVEAIITKLERSRANGDPEKYIAPLSVADAHYLARYVRAALNAALTVEPEAPTREPLTSAWLGYWPGAGSINSETRVTRYEHEAKRWRDDGAVVTELVERSPARIRSAIAP